MTKVVYLVSVIALTVVLQLVYEYLRERRSSKVHDERMESSMNDGCQTSVSLLGFAVFSAVIIGGVWFVLHS
jgi:Na+/H+ antiporter NhaD/arsenite permease-like protein